MGDPTRARRLRQIQFGLLLAVIGGSAGISGCGPFRETALQRAIRAHDVAGAQRALDSGAAPVEYLARQRSVEAVQVLLDAGLDRESQGVTNALVYAIAEDDSAMAHLLIDAGARLDTPADEGGSRFGAVTPLEAARRKGNAALVETLQAKNAG